jgi:hypothetical protein
MADQVWEVLSNAVDDHSAPIVTAEDDVLDAQAFRESSDCIGVVFVAVAAQIRRVSLKMEKSELAILST